MSLNSHFHILNNIIHFFTHFFTHVYFKKPQTIILKLSYQTLPKFSIFSKINDIQTYTLRVYLDVTYFAKN